jgi:hypothetical protein
LVEKHCHISSVNLVQCLQFKHRKKSWSSTFNLI